MSNTTSVGTKTIMTATLISMSSFTFSNGLPTQIDVGSEYTKNPYANITGYDEGSSGVSTDLSIQNRFSEQATLTHLVLRSPENRKSKIYVYKTKIKEDIKRPSSLGDGYLVSEV